MEQKEPFDEKKWNEGRDQRIKNSMIIEQKIDEYRDQESKRLEKLNEREIQEYLIGRHENAEKFIKENGISSKEIRLKKGNK